VPELHLIGPSTQLSTTACELLKVLREGCPTWPATPRRRTQIQVAVSEGPRLVLTVEDDGVGPSTKVLAAG
jgi:hypothetical protein